MRIGPYRFFFYSNENMEPPHIHVEAGEKTAKYWLEDVELGRSHGFNAHELNQLRQLVAKHKSSLLEAWHDHFKRKS